MTVYAYLRVSTQQQDEQNQRLGIDKKAEQLNLTIDKYIIDKKSGATDPSERNLGKLLKKLKTGDILLISEISRLSRKLFSLFSIIKVLLEKQVTIYSVKDGYTLDASIQSKILAFAFGISAELERQLLSQRTKEALAHKREQGVILGRPKGSKSSYHKLDSHKTRLLNDYEKGATITSLAKRYKVSHKTVKKYVDRYRGIYHLKVEEKITEEI